MEATGDAEEAVAVGDLGLARAVEEQAELVRDGAVDREAEGVGRQVVGAEGGDAGSEPVGGVATRRAVGVGAAVLGDAPDLATLLEDVELAVRVLTERGDGGDARGPRRIELLGALGELRHLAVHVAEGPDAARAVVGVEIGPLQGRDRGAAVDVASGHGAAERVAVLLDRIDEGGGVARAAGEPRAVVPLHAAPAVVLSARAGGRLEVDLLPGVLANVGDVHVAGGAVEGEAPGVPEARRPDRVEHAAVPDEGVAGGHEGRRGVHVEAQHLAQVGRAVLGAVARVVGAAAVPEGDVEVAVGAEGDLAAVVVREGLVLSDDLLDDGGVAHVGVTGHQVLGDARVATAGRP